MVKEDLRVVRSRKNMSTALKNLLQEKSFDKITIGDICDKANVHRATFYNHFADKTELLEYVFDEILEELQTSLKASKITSTKVMYKELMHKIVEAVLAYKKNLKLILSNSSKEFERVVSQNVRRGIEYLLAKDKSINVGEQSFKAVTCFMTGGFSALCIELVLGDDEIDVAKIENYLDSILDISLAQNSLEGQCENQ